MLICRSSSFPSRLFNVIETCKSAQMIAHEENIVVCSAREYQNQLNRARLNDKFNMFVNKNCKMLIVRSALRP